MNCYEDDIYTTNRRRPYMHQQGIFSFNKAKKVTNQAKETMKSLAKSVIKKETKPMSVTNNMNQKACSMTRALPEKQKGRMITGWHEDGFKQKYVLFLASWCSHCINVKNDKKKMEKWKDAYIFEFEPKDYPAPPDSMNVEYVRSIPMAVFFDEEGNAYEVDV